MYEVGPPERLRPQRATRPRPCPAIRLWDDEAETDDTEADPRGPEWYAETQRIAEEQTLVNEWRRVIGDNA